MLNELELTFLACIIEKNNFNYNYFKNHAKNMPDLMNIMEVKDVEEYNSIILYLFIVAYVVKVEIIFFLRKKYFSIIIYIFKNLLRSNEKEIDMITSHLIVIFNNSYYFFQ